MKNEAEEFYLPGYNTVYSVERQPTFRKKHAASMFRVEE
jgi:hypothetical protein